MGSCAVLWVPRASSGKERPPLSWSGKPTLKSAPSQTGRNQGPLLAWDLCDGRVLVEVVPQLGRQSRESAVQCAHGCLRQNQQETRCQIERPNLRMRWRLTQEEELIIPIVSYFNFIPSMGRV